MLILYSETYLGTPDPLPPTTLSHSLNSFVIEGVFVYVDLVHVLYFSNYFYLNVISATTCLIDGDSSHTIQYYLVVCIIYNATVYE